MLLLPHSHDLLLYSPLLLLFFIKDVSTLSCYGLSAMPFSSL